MPDLATAVPHERWEPDEVVDRVLSLCAESVQTRLDSDLVRERIFAELDDILLRADDNVVSEIRRHPSFRAIRERFHLIRADYEFGRELAVAEAIVDAGSEAAAKAFRSAEWYGIAQDFEIRGLAPFQCERMLWVGAGPFPTSPISFLRANPSLSVTCVDRDAEACRLAEEVARIFDCPRLEVVHADAMELLDFSPYDCVVVGLVVGVTDVDKRRVVEHFLGRVPESMLLAFRTAVGPGTIIWPSVDLNLLQGVAYQVLPDPPQKLYSMILVDCSESQG